MPLVWPCQESTVDATQVVLGQAVLLAQPLDRVGGVVDGLVAGGEDRDERVAVVRRRASTSSISPVGVPSSSYVGATRA